MNHVHIAAELGADEYGPHEVYTECLTPPPSFARDAEGAHSRLLTLLVTERYLELPPAGDAPVPLRSETVREMCVWGSRMISAPFDDPKSFSLRNTPRSLLILPPQASPLGIIRGAQLTNPYAVDLRYPGRKLTSHCARTRSQLERHLAARERPDSPRFISLELRRG